MDWSSGKWVPGPNVFFVVCCNFLLLYNNLFIYQVLCTLIYRRRSLYSFLLHLVLFLASIWCRFLKSVIKDYMATTPIQGNLSNEFGFHQVSLRTHKFYHLPDMTNFTKSCLFSVVEDQLPWVTTHCQACNINHTKSQNLLVSRLILQLSLPNPLKPGVKSRMKM